jgi:hypothetical protein
MEEQINRLMAYNFYRAFEFIHDNDDHFSMMKSSSKTS